MLRTFFLLLIANPVYMLAGGVYASSSRLVHDANYYILEAQHAEQWMADDKVVDKKLAEFRKKYGGKQPNIVNILIDDLGFGDMGTPELDAIRGYETPNVNKLADQGGR